MENQTSDELAIFGQICDVNKLEPQLIEEVVKKRNPEKSVAPEVLIWTAFDYRAQALVKETGVSSDARNNALVDKKAYTIDSDPAAPSFKVNEEFIRSEFTEEEAEKLIQALGHVKLPVSG